MQSRRVIKDLQAIGSFQALSRLCRMVLILSRRNRVTCMAPSHGSLCFVASIAVKLSVSYFISSISLRWASMISSASLRTRASGDVRSFAGKDCDGVMRNHRLHVRHFVYGTLAANEPQSYNEHNDATGINANV